MSKSKKNLKQIERYIINDTKSRKEKFKYYFCKYSKLIAGVSSALFIVLFVGVGVEGVINDGYNNLKSLGFPVILLFVAVEGILLVLFLFSLDAACSIITQTNLETRIKDAKRKFKAFQRDSDWLRLNEDIIEALQIKSLNDIYDLMDKDTEHIMSIDESVNYYINDYRNITTLFPNVFGVHILDTETKFSVIDLLQRREPIVIVDEVFLGSHIYLFAKIISKHNDRLIADKTLDVNICALECVEELVENNLEANIG